MYLFKDDESYELSQICQKLNGFDPSSCKQWLRRWGVPKAIVNRQWCVLGKRLNQAIANGPLASDKEGETHAV